MSEIKIGSRVRWIGRAGGYEKKRSGVVMHIVAAGEIPDFKWYGLRTDATVGREKESYVIRDDVTRRYCWPVVYGLRVVKP